MIELEQIVADMVEAIRIQMYSRGVRVANELYNSSQEVLRHAGSGRRYKIPHTRAYYTASAPGEPPALRTGAYRGGFTPKTYAFGDSVISRVENEVTVGRYVLGQLLENGTPGGQMAPRPHAQRILDMTEPKAVRIYSEPYF